MQDNNSTNKPPQLLYTALSVAEASQLSATKKLGSASAGEMFLTEDPDYWYEAMKTQPDEDDPNKYRYVFLMSIELQTGGLPQIMQQEGYGRFSSKVAELIKQAGRTPDLPLERPEETNVLVCTDTYPSKSGSVGDGMTQHYVLRYSDNSPLLKHFNESIRRIIMVVGLEGVEFPAS